MKVDDFLGHYFRHGHRRRSPRALVYDTEGVGGRDVAQAADARYTHALCIMGHLEGAGAICEVDVAVMRAYYLSLANHLVPVVRDSGDIDDIKSFADWTRIARGVGLANGKRAWYAFRAARSVVSDELRARMDTT